MLLNLLAEAGKDGKPAISTYIIMGVIVLAIIGLFIWQTINNKKKQKEAQDMMNNLQPGVKIKTIGGICGYLVEMNEAENTFILETGTEDKKCYIKFDKGAIYQTGAAANAPAKEVVKEAKVEEKPVEEVKTEETVEEKPAE